MYVVTVVFETKAEKHDSFRKAVLRQAQNSITKEEGCHRFDVCQDPDDKTRFFLYEIYDDKAAFDLHLQSEHYLGFDALTKKWIKVKTPQGWNLIDG